MLDILFEKRNKDYGAYALRRGYDKRLLTALVAGLLIILFFILLSVMNKTEQKVPAKVVIQKVEIKNFTLKKEKEPEKTKEPEKPKQPVKKKQPAVAQAKFTSPPVIKKDDKVKEALTTQDDMKDKKIGTENIVGKPADPIVKLPETPVDNKSGGNGGSQETIPNFIAQEKDPEFPGGPAALHKFLQNNLRTPEEMEAGERKVVKIQFKVDKDGSVNSFEIVTSGGSEFDDEVVRVCRKMPRWIPAIQNGTNVPVTFMIPVTFVGLE
jgi:periplasmic protein TonB